MSNTTQTDLSFLERCTAVAIQCHSLSFSKKLPKAAIQTDSDPSRINGSKKLLDCDQAAAIKNEFSRLKKFVDDRSLPTPFGKGIKFVPNTRLEEVDTELLLAQRTTIPNLVRALTDVYADVLRREEEALQSNFNPADYDTPEEIRARVDLDFSYVTFGIPQGLPDEIRRREAEKQGQRLMESVEAMQSLLRSEMAKLVDHAVEKLSGKKEDGKPLTFKNSTIDNIREFLTLFKDRNITNDTQMENLCSKAEQLLEGVDPKDLREKEPLRDSVAAGFAQIKEQLDALMVPKGSRVITFEDDAEADSAAA